MLVSCENGKFYDKIFMKEIVIMYSFIRMKSDKGVNYKASHNFHNIFICLY